MTKYDKILIILVLIISLIFIVFISKSTANYKHIYAEIYLDGELHKKYLLDHKLNETITLETKYGKNIIEIEGYNVRMIESSCNDKLCVKQGSIQKNGQLIVCLPNKIVVQIVGGNDDDDVDATSY